MKEFITAAKDSIGEVDEEESITFKHDGRDVTFFKPTSGQAAIMMTMGGRDMEHDPKAAGLFIQLFLELMDDETERYFSNRLLDRKDPFSDLSIEGGLFDIFENLMEEWSDRPTKEPSDYQPPRRANGRGSTGNSRGKALTSSPSRSRASSR